MDVEVLSGEELALLTDDELYEYFLLAEQYRKLNEAETFLQPKQQLAEDLAHSVDELLYGGAAGGGKSHWLIEHVSREMLAHRFNRGLILRRVFPSLNRTIIPKARAQLYGKAKWNGVEHTFTFPNGSVLELGHLQYDATVHDYQGSEYGVIAFEEVTEFTLYQYEYMLSRLRSPAPGIRAHSIATTNPGGRGHRWVKRRWVKPKQEDYPQGEPPPEPFKPWRPVPLPDALPSDPLPGTRVFVPATLDDNPALTQRDPGYRARIRAQSNRGMRLALEKGDWDAIDAVEGALWTQTNLDAGRLTPAYIGLHVQPLRRVLALDPSDGDEDGDEFGVWMGFRATDGCCYTELSVGWKGMSVRQMAANAIALYHKHNCDAIVVERNHGGKWMIEVLRSVDRYANIVEVWASHGKITRAEPVAVLFEPDPEALFVNRFKGRLIGVHEQLEEELTSFTGEGASPNLLDALVWGHHNLMLKGPATGQVDREDERLTGRR